MKSHWQLVIMMCIILAIVLRKKQGRHPRYLEMMRKLNNLTIGRIIFLFSTIFMGVILLFSSLLSFRFLFMRVDNLVETTSKEINKQVILNYENYLSSVIDTSSTLQGYIIEATRENDFESLDRLFKTTTDMLNNTLSIVLLDQSGYVLASSRYDGLLEPYNTHEWYQNASRNTDIHHFSRPHTQTISSNGNQEVFTISKAVDYFIGETYRSGVLVIDIQTSELMSLIDKTNLGEQGHILIIGTDDSVIFSNRDQCYELICESHQVVNDMILGGEAHDVDGTKMYVNVNTINATRWKIATFYDIQSINQAQYQMIINLLIAFMITIILIAIASIIVSERINSPMKQLRKAISALEKGSYDVSLDVKGQKEIVDLAKAFSEMRIRIKDLMHEVIKEQREKEETHFQALQSQINPHFLYNTLDSIVWLSENNRNKDVEKAIIALSKFFRRSVNSENIVTLEEEIDHVFNYLLIQQIRYQNQFNFEIDINDSLKEQRILKLSLQPLVENAIIHGIQPEDDFKIIRVSGYEKDGFIYVEVFNEGYGLTALNIHRILMNIKGDASTTSMGLRNVYQRIKLLYGDLGDLMIESELDEYTKVILKIPRDKDEGG